MKTLLELIRHQRPKVGNTIFIAVDGHGGSGKSTVAEYLSGQLKAEIIHTDDFASWDNPLNWWPKVIQKVFEPINQGEETLNYDRSKWWENHNPEPAVNQPVTRIMILEGVSSMRKEFEPFININIFIDTPRELCFQRGIERDLSSGKSREELEAMWNNELDGEEGYMQRDDPKSKADIIIEGTKPINEQLKF